MRYRVFPTGGPAAEVKICLVFPREALSVPVMRRVLGDTLSRLGVDEACIGDLLLAVTEACTNVLRHSGPGRRYEVVAHVSSKQCTVQVVDTGRGFDPVAVAGRSLIRPSVGPVARLRRPTPRGNSAPPSPATLRARITRSRRMETERGVADLPESGRGLAIMRACVDDVTLRTRPGQGTVVSLQKRIEWRSDAPLARRAPSQLRNAG
jgi:serine/threonine-protein kinase RsbW